MSNKELTSLSIRIFAIYVLVQAILLIAQSSTGINGYFQGDEKWLILIPVFSIIGLFILFYSLWKLSHSVFREVTTSNKAETQYKVDQIFILQLVGFYLLLTALTGLAQGGLSLYYTYIVQAKEYGSTYQPEMTSQSIVYLISSTIKLLVGIAIVIKPLAWSNLFNRLRNFGLTDK